MLEKCYQMVPVVRSESSEDARISLRETGYTISVEDVTGGCEISANLGRKRFTEQEDVEQPVVEDSQLSDERSSTAF